MVLGHLYYMIQIEKTAKTTTAQDGDDVLNSSSNNPFFILLDFFIYCAVFNNLRCSFSKFWFFLLSGIHSKVRTEKKVSDSELIHDGSREKDGNILERDDVKMVMGKLGFFCSPESEDLDENYGSREFSGLFEEEEPSLEEVKQAFDVFDENRDGFIDEKELQRVLAVLGFKEASERNCKKMIRKFDENGDGRIDFKEFVKIMENSFC